MHRREVLLRLAALAVLLYAICFYASSRVRLDLARQEEQRLEQELEELCRQHAELQQRAESDDDPELIAALARERLGLVMPGEKVFCFQTEQDG